MNLLFFAVLKEYFPPSLHIKGNEIKSCIELKNHLISLNKDAENVLKSCRFAVNNKFISEDFVLDNSHTIAIIPPSSGG